MKKKPTVDDFMKADTAEMFTRMLRGTQDPETLGRMLAAETRIRSLLEEALDTCRTVPELDPEYLEDSVLVSQCAERALQLALAVGA